MLPARDFHDYLRILMPLVYDFICCSNFSISLYIYLRYLPLIFQFAWLSAYHLKEHTDTLHIPTWWLELAFNITQPNFMAGSYSRKCLVSRQLLYFEEIKVFPLLSMETTYWRIWRDGQASLKGMPNMCTYFVLIEYFLSLKGIGIYTITFEQTYSSAKLFQGKKSLCGTQISMRILLFKQNVGASMCTVSFTKEWILWSHSHYMMHECKPQYWNKPNNFVLQKWYLLDKLLWSGKMRWKRNFKKWYIA